MNHVESFGAILGSLPSLLVLDVVAFVLYLFCQSVGGGGGGQWSSSLCRWLDEQRDA